MRNSIFFLFIVFVLSLTSCREDFDFERSSGGLEFSRDTVYLDTVFSNIGSSTYTLKVYNRSSKDISIPAIQLEKGLASKYRMMVDGMQGNQGKIFNNVELLAKDSLYIFIETTANIADANADDFLYTDRIMFDSGTNEQAVNLVTLIQDAYFIYPNRENGVYDSVDFGEDENGEVTKIRGRTLVDNHPINGNEFVWGNTKPYVIYGYASVPASQTLTVNAGARIHFHADSGIIVQDGGSLKINGEKSTPGTLDKEVIFEGDRLEPSFSDSPGQWGLIYLRQGSRENSATNLTLKNATVGFYTFGNNGLDNPTADLTLKNVQIYNSANAGIFAQGSYITGENVVINLAGNASLFCNLGGKYNFTNSTFNNNWSGTQKYAVRIDNYINDGELTYPLVDTKFENCIIYSSNTSGLLIDKKESANPFNYTFTKCLIKLSTAPNVVNNPLYAFMADATNIIQNKNPEFLDANKNKLQIGPDSPAKGTGTNIGGEDILGQPRNSPSDLGAYNFTLE